MRAAAPSLLATTKSRRGVSTGARAVIPRTLQTQEQLLAGFLEARARGA